MKQLSELMCIEMALPMKMTDFLLYMSFCFYTGIIMIILATAQ